MSESLVSFAGVAALLVMAPGVDFALVLRNGLVARKYGLATSLGVVGGLVLHTGLAVAGLSVLLRSPVAVFVLYAVSGGYLLWLGARGFASLWAQHRAGAEARVTQPKVSGTDDNTASAFRSGFIVNALNPKAPVLFLSIMPQFIPEGAADGPYSLLLGGTVVLCALAWFPPVALTANRLGPVLTRPRVKVAVDGMVNLVILTLGVLQLVELMT